MTVVKFCNDDPGSNSVSFQACHPYSAANIPTAATYTGAKFAFGTATLLITFIR